MNIIDCAPLRALSLFERIRSSLMPGGDAQAQESVISVLQRELGEDYILLRNLTLPPNPRPLPLILLGPAGIFLIHVFPGRGAFRVRGEEWGVIKNEHFVPTLPNPVRQTLQYTRHLQDTLEAIGFKDLLRAQPILLAAHPSAHVETVRPASRVVVFAALPRFAYSIATAPAALSAQAVNHLSGRLLEYGGENKKNSLAPQGGDRPSQADSPAPASRKQAAPTSRWKWLAVAGVIELLLVLLFLWYIFQHA